VDEAVVPLAAVTINRREPPDDLETARRFDAVKRLQSLTICERLKPVVGDGEGSCAIALQVLPAFSGPGRLQRQEALELQPSGV
jgi:hypothetical protein